VPDPNATKPATWDDEEDGVWEAPLVDNPACKVGKRQKRDARPPDD